MPVGYFPKCIKTQKIISHVGHIPNNTFPKSDLVPNRYFPKFIKLYGIFSQINSNSRDIRHICSCFYNKYLNPKEPKSTSMTFDILLKIS